MFRVAARVPYVPASPARQRVPERPAPLEPPARTRPFFEPPRAVPSDRTEPTRRQTLGAGCSLLGAYLLRTRPAAAESPVERFSAALQVGLAQAEHALPAIAERIRDEVGRGPGYIVLDTSAYFPAPLSSALAQALLEEASAEKLILELGRPTYRTPPKKPVPPKLRELTQAYFAWLDRALGPLLAEHGTAAFSQVRSVRAGSGRAPGDPFTETWHRDGSLITTTVALLGPGTDLAPGGVYRPHENDYQVDAAETIQVPRGHTVIFRGGAWPVAPSTIHRAPSTRAPRLVLVNFTYGTQAP